MRKVFRQHKMDKSRYHKLENTGDGGRGRERDGKEKGEREREREREDWKLIEMKNVIIPVLLLRCSSI